MILMPMKLLTAYNQRVADLSSRDIASFYIITQP